MSRHDDDTRWEDIYSRDIYDDEELRFIFEDYVNERGPIKWDLFDINLMPSHLIGRPKGPIRRGITTNTVYKNGQIVKFNRRRSWTTSKSIAKEFAKFEGLGTERYRKNPPTYGVIFEANPCLCILIGKMPFMQEDEQKGIKQENEVIPLEKSITARVIYFGKINHSR